MVSGFITSIQGCIVSRKHVVVGKVRHSQRMNDPLHDLCLSESRERWNSQISSLHRMQSRACRIMLTRSKRVIFNEAWTRMANLLTFIHNGGI